MYYSHSTVRRNNWLMSFFVRVYVKCCLNVRVLSLSSLLLSCWILPLSEKILKRERNKRGEMKKALSRCYTSFYSPFQWTWKCIICSIFVCLFVYLFSFHDLFLLSLRHFVDFFFLLRLIKGVVWGIYIKGDLRN